jgi:hypothetical protein
MLSETLESFWSNQDEGQQSAIRFWFDSERRLWRFVVSPKLHEIVGGAKDGERYWTPFVFEAGGFCNLSEVEIQNFAVASRCDHTALREPRMLMAGKYRGNKVFIEIFLEPEPQDGKSDIPF